MRRPALAALALTLACVAFPVRSETHRNPGPPFSIDYPDGWKILPGEGGLATRAVGPGDRARPRRARGKPAAFFRSFRFGDASAEGPAQ